MKVAVLNSKTFIGKNLIENHFPMYITLDSFKETVENISSEL